MRSLSIFLSFIFFTILVSSIQINCSLGQSVKKYNKYIEKAAKSFEKGKYEKALSLSKKLEQKSTEKFGNQNQFIAVAKLKQAKYNWALGQFTNYYKLNDEAIEISKAANGDKSISHGINLIDASQNMVNYGNYVLAYDYLIQAIEIFEKSPEAGEAYMSDLKLRKAEILTAIGQYNQALKLINQEEPFYLQRTLNKDGNVDKDELERRYQDAARLITLKSNVLRHKGEIRRADSAFSVGENWIKDKLNRRNKYFAEHLYLFAEFLEENGTRELPFSYYSDAYVFSISSNGDHHPQTLKYLEKLIINTINEDNINRALAYYKDLDKILKLNFEKSSSHFVKLASISFISDLKKGKIEKVEKAAQKLTEDKNLLPSDHPINIDLLYTLKDVASAKNQYQNAQQYLKEIVKLKSQLYGDTSINTALSRIDLAHHLLDYSDNFEEAVGIYEKEFFGKVENEITSKHYKYVPLLNHLASAYQIDDDYEKASKMLDEALLVTREKYDNQDIDFGKELNLIADLQIKIGEYEKAGENINESLKILENFNSDFNIVHYIMALETYAKLMSIKGFFDESEEALELSQKLYSKSVPSPEYNPLTSSLELASVYMQVGKYSETEEILTPALKNYVTLYGKDSRKLILPLTDFGRLELIKGNYTKTEELARRALEISEKIFGIESTKNAPAVLLLGELYETLGDFDKSEEYYSRAITILEKQFGRDHVDVATTISKLAIVMFYEGGEENDDEIQKLLFEAKEIIGKRFSTKSPLYADLLKDMARFFISENKLDEALDYLAQSEEIWIEKAGRRNNIKAADIHILRGDIYYKQRKWREAENEYEESQKVNEKFFNDKHPEYVKATSRLSKVYFMNGDERKAKQYIDEVMFNYNRFIKEYFPALSEREKTKYWNTIKNDYNYFNTIALKFYDRYPEMIESVYNNALKTKGLLLSSSIKMRERILNSNDSTLKQQYFNWLDKKELLSNAISMSSEQLDNEGINVGQLSREVELIEKSLSQQSDLFSEGITQEDLDWKKIRQTLQPNEVAIEMVRFRYFDHYVTDSVVYLMLILKNDTESKPEYVVMENGNDMESKFFNNYRNAIKYRVKDSFSYRNFWEPIEQKIGENKTIYISADGVYNQINLEAIPLQNNQYLIDKANIVLLSNTKDLYLKKSEKENNQEQKSALLFGDPKFYIASRNDYISEFRSGATQISDLPGTQKEINALTELFQKNGWKTSRYTKTEAAEETVKNTKSPNVFHIATHGFFTEKEDRNPDNSFENNQMNQNPLLNTGLMLKGSGDLLAKTRYNYNLEPGILTAYEAMNLNFDKTDLVVLSACETGLGEVHGGEGVYGLQRSFLVAGAETLIMSLFKVSDEATQKLMVSFYEKWLETGDKRNAFIDAKKEIRNEYKDPIYWGAFVMIGL
ncbi:CHAT domain-containing protein [Marivirga arenosa]|uniref:CHAT domain-containing protein n=1 Tax=Marivirga arenosa TaxID=3059076 RepID=A0AA51R660_9BACT|nr:CHAT domain-containing protein [Marivirga sp. ABR2-2]WMN06337.1 CHAT domain-containing protein [Marivirga sp. ABR2-2]